MRKLITTALAVTVATTSLTSFAGAAEARRRHDGDRDRYERHWDRGDRHHRRHRGNDDGAAIAAGVIGLVLGAAIASSNQSSGPSYAPTYSGGYRQSYEGYSDYDRACASRYWSYDPADGTYLAVDGYRYRCTL